MQEPGKLFHPLQLRVSASVLKQAQKIMTTKYSSFSVLGVGLILMIGGLFIALDLTLPFIVDYIQIRRSKKQPNPSGTYARLEWDTNTTLQLQRLAHEHIGVGKWSHRWMHPITAPGEKLGMIDVRDEEHTLFLSPNEWAGVSEKETPRSAGSDTASWESGREKVKRVGSQDSLGESELGLGILVGQDSVRRVKRVDTKATLVGSDVGTPTEDKMSVDEINRVS